MSNGFKLELLKWGDGNDTLAYWDSLSGDDEIFVLSDDGKAYRSTENIPDNWDWRDKTDYTVLEEVNLVEALKKLLRRLEQEAKKD